MAKHADPSNGRVNGSSVAEEDLSTEQKPPAEEDLSTEQKPPAEEDLSTEEQPGQQGEHATHEENDESTKTRGLKRLSSVELAIIFGVVVVVALGCVGGWWGYRTYEIRQAQAERNELVAVARQGALNLTTIDYTRVDADVRRILDSSTGNFHDDFQQRSQPFIDVVKKAQSKSEGTITEAGIESQDGDLAQVLVAVTVKTSIPNAPDQDPRRWRMRIGVQKLGDVVKVANVQFVP